MLELLYRPLIILHIITGLIAMGASMVAFATSKWSHWHKKAGNVFFVTMLITSLASIPSGIVHEKWALVMLCVFSFHLTYTGKRYLAFRRQEKPTLLDYASSIMILVFGILLLTVGIPTFMSKMGPMGAIAPAAFGFISLSMAREDYQWYQNVNRSPKLALRRHIGRMGGATIAVFTAFFVNVNFVIPSSIAWIIPTVIGSFLIAWFMRKLRLGQPIRQVHQPAFTPRLYNLLVKRRNCFIHIKNANKMGHGFNRSDGFTRILKSVQILFHPLNLCSIQF